MIPRRLLPAALLAVLFTPLAATPAFAQTSAAAEDPAAPAADRKTYVGWIPMQPVYAGDDLVLDMHRFYYGTTEDQVRHLEDGENFDGNYNPESYELRVQISQKASGIIEIPFQVFSRKERKVAGDLGRKSTDTALGGDDEAAKPHVEALLAIAVLPQVGATFTYKTDDPKVTKVNVAGQFNGWNTDSHPLKQTGRGQFELFVPMNPGTYAYKLLVNGQWTPDPANPERETGSDNSLVRVAGTDTGRAPQVYVDSVDGDVVTFRLVPGDHEITQLSAVLQLPSGSSRKIEAKREGDLVKVDASGQPALSWIRLAVADTKGNVSNAARGQIRPDGKFQWQDGVIYYAFTDRFRDGNPANNRPVADERVPAAANYQGGDFEGIEEKIKDGYFRQLGVNVLWLAPLNRNPDGAWQEYLPPYRHYTGYHGYWPVSHKEVEPRFGGEQALRSMISSAHENDTKIIADLVLKHVHVDHPLWKEKPEWFGSLDLPDGTKNLRRWDDHQFTTWFEEWLPGFDFDRPDPVRFLIGNAVWWAREFNLDGYRLDAVKHIKLSFWWRFRANMRNLVSAQRPLSMYFVGETFMDRRGIMSFVGPNMLDGQFDFPLYDTIIDVFAKQAQGFEELEKSLAASESIYGKETLMSPLVGNHDKSRFMAYADGDLPDPKNDDEEEVGWSNPPQVDNPAAYRRLELALSFILAIDGVPMIYYGDEVGLSGAGDPDNRRMMPWGDDVKPEQEAVRAHFSKVAALRHQHPALRYGNRRPLVAEGSRYAFVRRHLDDRVLAVWNRGDKTTQFNLEVAPELSDGTYTDALSGQKIEVKGGRTVLRLEPMKSAFFVPGS